MYYFVKNDFSPLIEIQIKIKLKSHIAEVKLLIGNRQSRLGKVTFRRLFTYNPHKEWRSPRQEHLQALPALSEA